MSDLETPVDSGESSAVDPAETAPETPSTDPVPRAEYEKLQEENRKYRERWKPYETALKDFHDDDRDFLLKEWLPSYISDPEKFVTYTQKLLEQMTPAEQKAVDEAVTEATEEKGSALTAEQVAEIVKQQLAERDRSAAQEAEIQKVYADLKEQGYDDPQSTEAKWILHLALTETEGDIAKAVEKHRQREQQIIDQFLQSKGQGPTLPPQGSSAAPVRDEPKNLAEAAKMATAAFKARHGG